LSVYLDASALVAMFTEDPFTARIRNFLVDCQSPVIVSDFAAAEFAATVARHARSRLISLGDARTIFSTFDTWTTQAADRMETTTVEYLSRRNDAAAARSQSAGA